MKKICIIIILIGIICLSGCGGNDDNNTISVLDNLIESNKKNNEDGIKVTDIECFNQDTNNLKQKDETSKGQKDSDSDENIIVWAFMEDNILSAEIEERVNRQLEKDGYPFRLRCEILCSDLVLKGEKKYVEYRKRLQECHADIVYTGPVTFTNADNTIIPPALEAIHNDKLFCLDTFLKNSRLYETLPESIWDSVRVDGKIYCVPNTVIGDAGLCIAFKKSEFTKEEIDAFDDTVEGLVEMLSEKKKLFCASNSFLDMYDINAVEGYGIYYDGNSIKNLMELDLNIKWIKEMNRLYRRGILLENKKDVFSCAEEWAVAMVYNRDSKRFDPDKYYIKNYKGDIDEHFTASVAIKKDSHNPELAYKMLELFLTDPRYANLIIYGEDVKEIDGVAVDPETGAPIDAFNRKLTWGINDAAYKCASDFDRTFGSPEERKEYYAKYCRPANNLYFNYPEQMFELNQLYEKHYNIIFNDKNFDDELSEWILETKKIFSEINS